MKLMPPTRIWLAVMLMTMMASTLYSQHLSSARATSMGAFTAFAGDINSLDWNPAGLVGIKDWELEATNFYAFTNETRSLSFHTIGIGKYFMNGQAAAFRFSPGLILEFDVPSTFTVGDSSNPLVATFDKKISYDEQYAFGYAFMLENDLALGLSAHFLEEKIADTKYYLDSSAILHSTIQNYSGTSWSFDWGATWFYNREWRIGAVAKNLFRITETPLAEEVRQYSLTTPKFLRFGLLYDGMKEVSFGFDGDTEKRLRLGGEWMPTKELQFRSGLYLDGSEKFSADAIAFGIGATYHIVQLDISYLKFFSQTNRGGTANVDAFQQSGIGNIEYNQFTSDRISLTANIQLGRTRETMARIEYVEMISDIFPASRNVYAFRPIGKARVHNITEKPIDVKVSFYVDRYMDAPTETKPHTIAAGEVLEIPFYAVFNEAVHTISSLLIRDGDVYVNATPQQDYDDRYQTRILMHGRNDWNGDAMLLKYFVTPDDPDVLKFTRSHLTYQRAHIDSINSSLQQLEKAKIIFNDFSQRLLYINDPKKSEDFVQYPAETIALHGGDCDDMSVCYSALLASMGISTAFIDVVPPSHPEQSHIYMMFDTGIDPKDALLLGNNPKRYIIRKNEQGKESLWIPVETTVITKGFDEAWSVGAEEYFNDIEVKLGIFNGWVRLIDMETVY